MASDPSCRRRQRLAPLLVVAALLLMGCSKGSGSSADDTAPGVTTTDASSSASSAEITAYCDLVATVVDSGKKLVVSWNNPSSTVDVMKGAMDEFVAAIDPVLAQSPASIKADAADLSQKLHAYQAEAKPLLTRDELNTKLVPEVKALFEQPTGVGKSLSKLMVFVTNSCPDLNAS